MPERLCRLKVTVPDDVAATIRANARRRNWSVSKYIASVFLRDIHPDWPDARIEDTLGGRWRQQRPRS